MSLTSYLSFCLLVFSMVYSPGPMTMYMMANGMRLPYSQIWPILVGANNAYFISILVFSLGLTRLLQQYPLAMKFVQISGVIYLVYLAYQQWQKKSIHQTAINPSNETSQSSLYTKGALIAFSNPKTIILFGVIFPQFISHTTNQLFEITILGITFLCLQFSSGCVYAYFGSRIKSLIDEPFYQRLVNRISAVVLLVVAGFLIIKL